MVNIPIHGLAIVMAAALAAYGGETLDGEQLRRVTIALDRGAFGQASEGALALLQAHPHSAEAHVLLARAEIGLNRPAEGLRELHEALRCDLNNLDALYYTSKLTGVLSGQQFVDLERIAPGSQRTHIVRAEALAAKGDSASAKKEYLAALKGKPDAPFLLNALGDLERHQEQYPEASERYDKVLELEPENFDALYGLGACFLLSHQPVRAIPFFRRAIRVDPDSTAAAMALGEALLDSGSAREAVALLQRAASEDLTLQRVQFLLGRAYRALGEEKAAENAFARYREIAKQNSDPERPLAGRQP